MKLLAPLFFFPRIAWQLGEIDDAVECLEAILLHVHCESVGCSDASEGSDKVCNPTCPACSVFKVEYFDQAKCSKCDATTDPVVCGDFLYRIWCAIVEVTKDLPYLSD